MSRAVGTFAALAAAMGTRKLVTVGWKKVTGKEPPSDPHDPQVHFGEALSWAILLGVTMETARDSSAAGSRGLGRLIPPFHLTMTTTAALALLVVGAGAILNLRSPKYLGAVIVMSLAGAVFLALPKKFNFFLYAAGFTMPYFVEVILLRRDRAILAVTGTTLVIAVLAIPLLQ